MNERTTIEDWMLAVERALIEIQAQLRIRPKGSWLDRFNGAFADEPEFDEVTRLGRAIRKAERPETEPRPCGSS